MGLYYLLALVYLDPVVQAWVTRWCRKALELYVIITSDLGPGAPTPSILITLNCCDAEENCMSSVMTDQALIRTVSWGAIGGIVLTLFLILLGTINASDVNERQRMDRNTRYGASSGATERVKAVGQMNLASNTAASSATTQVAATATAIIDGKKIYNGMCVACHGAGVAGAPRVGDKGAWAERIDKGATTLYANAINGVQGSSGVMPAKGGNPALSDDEIKAVVDYMVAQSN
mgnify:FL=1